MIHRRRDLASLLFAAALAVLSGGAGALSWDPGQAPVGSAMWGASPTGWATTDASTAGPESARIPVAHGAGAPSADAGPRLLVDAAVVAVAPTLRPPGPSGRGPTTSLGRDPTDSAAPSCAGLRLGSGMPRRTAGMCPPAHAPSPLALGHPATAPPIAV